MTALENHTAAGIEMRVHGIGDHDIYSSLGSPTYSDDNPPTDQVRVGEAPRLPGHPLRLVNWSRASRGINRSVAWYLAFPFTLMNVAGYMGPLKVKDALFLRVGLLVSGILLTASMAVWVGAIIETALGMFITGPYPS